MPWRLDIHLVDVGQGDCTLIVAENTTTGQRRTMLIDGGNASYGAIAHDKIVDLQLPNVDHIVSTHYDIDHRGGLEELLLADNLSSVVRTLAEAAEANARGDNRPKRIASVTAAVYSAELGYFGDDAGTAAKAARKACSEATSADTDETAINRGIHWANDFDRTRGVQSLIIIKTVRSKVAGSAGVAAADALAAGQTGDALATAIRKAIFRQLQTKAAQFWTDNRYNTTHVIDLGASGEPHGWRSAVNGDLLISGFKASAPNVERKRTPVPKLGDEVLWNSGPRKMQAPHGAPQVYLVTYDAKAWQGIKKDPYVISIKTIGGNNCSIGLLIRFNDFFYCTLGDLESLGEDKLMAAVMSKGLPDPADGSALRVPRCVTSFKCSHHGANTSTSNAFLKSAKPTTALISAGFNRSYQHPGEELVRRLHKCATIERYYLTNCNFETDLIPASKGKSQQKVGNKSRVAGDSKKNNLLPGRNRGDLRLRVTQSGSMASKGRRGKYTVRYWEEDLESLRWSTSEF